jgi:oligopeptide transport system substrate-binding protein
MQDFRLTYAIREGLYGLDGKTFRPTPAGAVGFDLSPDKKVWTFHLRKEATWSDGTPVTAHDYEFSWRRMLDDPGPYTYLFFYVKGAQEYGKAITEHFASGGIKPRPDWASVGARAVDDLTFRVELVDPVPYLLDIVAFPPFYPRSAKSMEPFKRVLNETTGQFTYKGEYTRPPHVVTNGPFTLKQWDFKRRLRLERFEGYWDRANVQSASVEMVVAENSLSQFLLYEAGQVDWQAEVDGDLAATLKEKGREDLRVSPANGTMFLTFYCAPEFKEPVAKALGFAKNPLADVRVRQALDMSIDKKFIVDSITQMGELPARTYVPPDGSLEGFGWMPGPFNTGAKQRYSVEELRDQLKATGVTGDGPGLPYDVKRAKQLLAEAGYPEGKGFPALPIIYGTNSPTRQKICQVLKNQWKETLGIEVNLQGLEGKNFSDSVNNREYVIGTVAWYGDYPDASTFTDKYLSTSENNDSLWVSPAFDELCAKAAKEPDTDKRMRMLERAEHMINVECPIAPIYHYVNVSLSRNQVRGVAPNPRNITVFKNVAVDR